MLYDGVCGLCNRYVQFVLARDKKHHFRFAPLQGRFGSSALGRHGLRTDDPGTIVLLESAGTPAEKPRVRSDAVLAIVAGLGGAWRLAFALRVLPAFLRDAAYNLVARLRYRLFGKLDACALPGPADRDRFLD